MCWGPLALKSFQIIERKKEKDSKAKNNNIKFWDKGFPLIDWALRLIIRGLPNSLSVGLGLVSSPILFQNVFLTIDSLFKWSIAQKRAGGTGLGLI